LEHRQTNIVALFWDFSCYVFTDPAENGPALLCVLGCIEAESSALVLCRSHGPVIAPEEFCCCGKRFVKK